MGKHDNRKAIKEMMDSVGEGHAFTVYGKDGPLAMVLPWSDWQALNQKLVELERRYLPPSARRFDDPQARIPEDLWGQGDVAGVPPPEHSP